MVPVEVRRRRRARDAAGRRLDVARVRVAEVQATAATDRGGAARQSKSRRKHREKDGAHHPAPARAAVGPGEPASARNARP